jgi:trans-aconitate methyltransferase
MDDAAQALAYAEADFEEPNRRFLELLEARGGPPPEGAAVLDLGCGPGDITLRIARLWPGAEVHGLDGAEAMLAFGRAALAREPDLVPRVRFVQGLVPGASLPRERYEVIVSNSLLHHLHDPSVLWRTLRERAVPGARVLVMDLMRPSDEAEVGRLLDTYAEGEPEVLRRDFANSLRAAFTPDEVLAQLTAAGLGDLSVWPASDRHLVVEGSV